MDEEKTVDRKPACFEVLLVFLTPLKRTANFGQLANFQTETNNRLGCTDVMILKVLDD